MGSAEEMHAAMVNRSIRTIKAVKTAGGQLQLASPDLILSTGTRIPLRCLRHQPTDSQRIAQQSSGADSSPCADLSRRCTVGRQWSRLSSTNSIHEQSVPQRSAARTFKWLLR
jgi:hypothetical protein